MRLGGMTRLDGFVSDPATNDIILWGQIERGAPPLHFDDFVVAMRAASGRYIGKPGQPGYNLEPAISIDPDDAAMRSLRDLSFDDPDFDQRFEKICSTPQKVRVDGMPRHTRVAYVLVDADYRMKQVGQGSMKLPIVSPFPSHHEVSIQHSLLNLKRRRDLGGATNTRFWFSAKSFDYQISASGDEGFLETSQVVLEDEDEMLTASGRTASGKVNPLTRAFTCAWTERMEEVYQAEPIWRDMHNIFRHFALAKAIVDQGVLEKARFNPRVLLETYIVRPVILWDTLPGLGVIDRVENLRTWVCGGVSLGMNRLNSAPRLVTKVGVGNAVLSSRPSAAGGIWLI